MKLTVGAVAAFLLLAGCGSVRFTLCQCTLIEYEGRGETGRDARSSGCGCRERELDEVKAPAPEQEEAQ